MRNRADARYADFFALEVRRGLDLRPDHNPLQPLVYDSRNHDGVAAVQRRINERVSRRAGHLDIVGKQRADSRRAPLADYNDLRIDAVLAKQSFLLGDPHGAMKGAHRAEAQPDFVLSKRMGPEKHKSDRQAQQYH